MKERVQQHSAGRSDADIQQELAQRAEEQALRPPPVEGLVTGPATRTRLFDPSFTVARDITDHNGTVFARQGERVNPFDAVPVFDETLWFIDADDPRQIAWMKQQKSATSRSYVILVNGNIRDGAAALGSRVWFDQNGALTAKFGITQVPAQVSQVPGQTVFTITEYGLPDR